MKPAFFLTLLLSTAISITSATPASAQVKKSGGLFGFGKDNDQASSDLFPAENASTESEALANATNATAEKESSKKKSRFFGRKDSKDSSEAITPIPDSSYGLADEAVARIEETTEAVNAQVEETKKSGRRFGFFGKNNDEIAETPQFENVANAGNAGNAGAQTAPNPYQTSTGNTAPVASDPTPDFTHSEKAEKERFSFTSPIAKLRNAREEKPVDLTGAETIIQNGEIVTETRDIMESSTFDTGGASRQPPQVINGVTTYSSWDDIECRSHSAADRILSRMR